MFNHVCVIKSTIGVVISSLEILELTLNVMNRTKPQKPAVHQTAPSLQVQKPVAQDVIRNGYRSRMGT